MSIGRQNHAQNTNITSIVCNIQKGIDHVTIVFNVGTIRRKYMDSRKVKIDTHTYRTTTFHIQVYVVHLGIILNIVV